MHMTPRTTHLSLAVLLLIAVVMAGCAAVSPDMQSSAPAVVVEADIDVEPQATETPQTEPATPSPVDNTPTTVATTTDLADPTVTPTIPPTATPTITPTQTPTPQPRAAVVANDYGKAPEINSEVWLNTDQPLQLEDLRGKVVLVDFWTYG
jgi:hypothetical protein